MVTSLQYHQRFGHPLEAVKTCACGQMVRRRHLRECPIAACDNPRAAG
jgi:hypothetical protein